MVQPLTIYREGKLLELETRRVGWFRARLVLMGKFAQECHRAPGTEWRVCGDVTRPINPNDMQEVQAALALLQPSGGYRYVGTAKPLAIPADHCSVLAKSRDLPPGTPVYARTPQSEGG